MSEMSNGWVRVPLLSLIGEDGLFTDGDWVESKDQDPSGQIRLLQLADIGDGKFLNKSARFINDKTFVELRCTQLAVGDVLVARMPDPLGRACLMPELDQPCVTVVDVAAIRPGCESVVPSWLMHTINAPQFRQVMAQQASGTTRKRISRGNLAQIPVPVPPRPEQQRIADKLDTVLARVDACRDRLARVAPLLKRFRQSVLAAATSGRLTEDWRDGKAVQSEWAEVPLGMVLEGKPRNGYSPVSTDQPTSVRSLTLSATTSGKFKGEHFKYINEPIAPDSHLWLEPGDVLIQRANSLEHVGVSALFSGEPHSFIYPDLMMKARADRKRISPSFLHIALSHEGARKFFRDNATGTAGNMPKINQQTVMTLPIRLPSLLEQAEIVRRVKTLLAFADRLEARLAQVQTAVDRLTPSLLAKAFRGELVPQDPADEPAAELLNRLSASRAAPAPKTRKGRQAQTA